MSPAQLIWRTLLRTYNGRAVCPRLGRGGIDFFSRIRRSLRPAGSLADPESTQRGGYGLVLPLMIANMTAFALARHWAKAACLRSSSGAGWYRAPPWHEARAACGDCGCESTGHRRNDGRCDRIDSRWSDCAFSSAPLARAHWTNPSGAPFTPVMFADLMLLMSFHFAEDRLADLS